MVEQPRSHGARGLRSSPLDKPGPTHCVAYLRCLPKACSVDVLRSHARLATTITVITLVMSPGACIIRWLNGIAFELA